MALSREKILAAALEIADAKGLKKVTMRAVGAALDVEAMSLYRYVDSKSDLMDGLMEAVLSEVELPEPSGDWRSDGLHAGRELFAVFSKHPRTLELFASRPAVTPGSLTVLEQALTLLSQDGMDTAAALARFDVLFGFVVGFAITRLPHPGDLTFNVAYEELPAERHPHLSRLREVLQNRDTAAEFEMGLGALIQGL